MQTHTTIRSKLIDQIATENFTFVPSMAKWLNKPYAGFLVVLNPPNVLESN